MMLLGLGCIMEIPDDSFIHNTYPVYTGAQENPYDLSETETDPAYSLVAV
jgi:hypothetical protein